MTAEGLVGWGVSAQGIHCEGENPPSQSIFPEGAGRSPKGFSKACKRLPKGLLKVFSGSLKGF